MVRRSENVQITITTKILKIVDAMVLKGIYRNRTNAIETLVREGLEKRDLIAFQEGLE
ncbi:MAG: hypothetical protein ACXADY_04065 [Candidatus Hodarchaeales archaeon]|jgi:metal-responsive CopG/Arc/MetJ family transcriptional regulator